MKERLLIVQARSVAGYQKAIELAALHIADGWVRAAMAQARIDRGSCKDNDARTAANRYGLRIWRREGLMRVSRDREKA